MPLHRPVPTTTYRLPGTAAEQDSRQMRPTTNQHLNTQSPLPLPTKSSARKTKEKLQNTHPDINPNNIEWLLLDLTDLKSIDTAAHELKKKERKLDILINNAAVPTSSTELVARIWEQHMAANHVGHFLFVNRVLPLLKNALKAKETDVRIINLSSLAHVSVLPHTFKFKFDSAACLSNPVPSHPWQWRFLGRFIFWFDMVRYAVSKAAVVLFTKELQHRLDEQGLLVITIAVHPGEVATEGVMTINNAFISIYLIGSIR
ncbi:hypothetical protein N7460_011373 [Penicillium canescens]|uniref:Uncharacterized protein n=1 Tax=Penicillium canescens TaxID=5083 RepID=A0AAD6I0C0_PENCN|nr:hypothetical protein N7460_011373 [Penicillium canescens]KAJ6039840.1 hypothetical protein N7444_008745 [Penicillium canescens]